MTSTTCGRRSSSSTTSGTALTPAQAQDKLKIGFIATLSGPPAVLGTQLRNGFLLGIKNLGGKLGRAPSEDEIAGALGVSVRTVSREWQKARALLLTLVEG